MQPLLRDVILCNPLTARNVQFYGREDMKVQNTLRELCAELRVSRRAVQGYEKWGLLAPTGRNKYGHLLYDQNAKERVKTIRFYQRVGFTLKEIKELLDAPREVKKAAFQVRVLQLEEEHREQELLIEQVKAYIEKL